MEAKKDFEGRTAVVTGGGTGLGKAVAAQLCARGASVVIASRSKEHLEQACSEIAGLGGKIIGIPCDVRQPEQVESMVGGAVERYGRIDILVNNAAGNFLVPAASLTPNGWKAVIDIVLNGTWYCSSFAGRQMIEQGGGCILNIIATYAWTGAPGVVHSASAKGGVLAMTRTLAAEWGRHGVRVNALAPGVMVTEGAAKNLMFESLEVQERLVEHIPLRRLATTEEIARLAAFLCSDDAAYITGDVMTADGGRWLDEGFLALYARQTQTRV